MQGVSPAQKKKYDEPPFGARGKGEREALGGQGKKAMNSEEYKKEGPGKKRVKWEMSARSTLAPSEGIRHCTQVSQPPGGERR